MSPAKAPPQAPATRHPLLGLPPAARRRLAGALVQAAAAEGQRQGATQRRLGRQAAWRAGGALGGLTVLWSWGAGQSPWPLLLLGGVALGLQAWLAREAEASGALDGLPSRWRQALLTPTQAWRGLQAWRRPPTWSEASLLAAASALAGLRRPQARGLLVAFLGRGWSQREVEAGLALLEALGWVEPGAPPYQGILRLSPQGQALAEQWGLPKAHARGREEPKLPPAVLAAFQALGAEAKAPAEAQALPPIEPPPAEARPLGRALPPRREPAWPQVPEGPGLPLLAPEAPPREEEEGEEASLEGGPAPAGATRGRRVAASLLALALLLGLGWGLWRLAPATPGARWRLSSVPMPPGSQGVALQGDGRGMLLSLFGGSLFWSVTDRLDYKVPVKWEGLDAPGACRVGRGALRFAAASPSGRFLWLELGSAQRTEEACLVDLETKSVHHQLGQGLGPQGPLRFLGWAGEGQVIAQEGSHGPWWRLQGLPHQASRLQPPDGPHLLPVAGPDGELRILSWSASGTTWALQWHALQGQQWVEGLSANLLGPSAWSGAVPRRAALSPDQRFVLLSFEAQGEAALLVGDLASGQVQALKLDQPLAPEAPLMWEGPPRRGRYTFVVSLQGPEGPLPHQGSLQVEGAR